MKLPSLLRQCEERVEDEGMGFSNVFVLAFV